MAAKKRVARRYNSKLHPRMFTKGDFVWRIASTARKKDGKFSANLEGPFRIHEDIGGGGYKLEQLSRDEILNTWNVSHLKFYFS